MPKTLYVLYTNRLMRHGGDHSIKNPPGMARNELITLKLPHIPKNRYLHAQMFAELHGARPYPLIALYYEDPNYGTSIQIPTLEGMKGFLVHQEQVLLQEQGRSHYRSIDDFVTLAVRGLGMTKTFSTDLVMDCTPDQHYREALQRLDRNYTIKELVLN